MQFSKEELTIIIECLKTVHVKVSDAPLVIGIINKAADLAQGTDKPEIENAETTDKASK